MNASATKLFVDVCEGVHPTRKATTKKTVALAAHDEQHCEKNRIVQEITHAESALRFFCTIWEHYRP